MNNLSLEREKYKIIREKLINYRNKLDEFMIQAKNMEDIESSYILCSIYDRQIYQYEKNKFKPYFAKLEFMQDNENEKTIAYIGRIGCVDFNDEDIIIDWRAPISDLYYNSKLGRTYFLIDQDRVEGNLELKRQINFQDGEISSVVDINDNISNDEFLLPYLTDTNDNRLKNIISTIQSEQNTIIRFPISSNIIIQGVAGCGKTTVALHRLSYLIYNYRKSIKPENFLIISPNMVFKNYISALLEDLDADQTQSFSIEEVVKNTLKSEFNILEKGKQYENILKQKISTDYISFKKSNEFKNLLDNFIERQEKKWFYKDLMIRDVVVIDKDEFFNLYNENKKNTVEQTIEFLSKRVAHNLKNDLTINKKIDLYCNKFDISFKNKLFAKSEIENGIEKYIKKIFNNKLSAISLYKEFISEISLYNNYYNITILQKETLKNLNKKIISFDDIGPILYLYTKILKNKNALNIKHVLIDEAQDFSPLLFNALSNLFSEATFSIYGDLAQGIYEYQAINDWDTISNYFCNSKIINLNKSYRSTVEITSEANRVLKKLNLNIADNVIRHGEEVTKYKHSEFECNKNQMINELLKKYSTIAIIFKNNDILMTESKKLDNIPFMILNEKNIVMDSGLFLLTVETAKGLEFDAVIVFDASGYNLSSNLQMKQLYVAETRALHKLIIVDDIE